MKKKLNNRDVAPTAESGTLSYVLPPNKELVEIFMRDYEGQCRHIKHAALKLYNDWDLKALLDFDSFHSFAIMFFLTGRNTLMFEILEANQSLQAETEKVEKTKVNLPVAVSSLGKTFENFDNMEPESN